jgi:hypothetical protein
MIVRTKIVHTNCTCTNIVRTEHCVQMLCVKYTKYTYKQIANQWYTIDLCIVYIQTKMQNAY